MAGISDHTSGEDADELLLRSALTPYQWDGSIPLLKLMGVQHTQRKTQEAPSCWENMEVSFLSMVPLSAGYPHHPNSTATGVSLKQRNLFNKRSLPVNIFVMKYEVLAIQTLHINTENGTLAKN